MELSAGVKPHGVGDQKSAYRQTPSWQRGKSAAPSRWPNRNVLVNQEFTTAAKQKFVTAAGGAAIPV